jgi:UDP-2,3-diacylglucosamine pyrophosphatase LpxH
VCVLEQGQQSTCHQREVVRSRERYQADKVYLVGYIVDGWTLLGGIRRVLF